MCYILSQGVAGGGSLGAAPLKFFFGGFYVHFWAVFRHIVFADGFLFPVKELGLLNNSGYLIRVLDAAGSYMYIVL